MRWKTNGNLFLPTLSARESENHRVEQLRQRIAIVNEMYIFTVDRPAKLAVIDPPLATTYSIAFVCAFSLYFVAACFDRFIKLLMHYT